MMMTPILKTPIRPFDAKDDYNFIFYSSGGSQVLRNNLVIEDMETGETIYDEALETFALRHTLPANTLLNGVGYVAKIRVAGVEEKWSQFSEIGLFHCFSNPSIQITTIDYENYNRIYNQTMLMEATYEQLDNESLQSYRFLLYDSDKNLLKSFEEKFYSGEGSLSQEITGLDNDALYHVQVQTESVNGLLYDSDIIWFKPFYVTPQLSAVLMAENVSEQGAIKLSANIIQIVGTLYDKQGEEVPFEDIVYMEGGGLDLTDHNYQNIVFDKGFDINQSDFLMKIWCKNIPKREVFLRLSGNDGFIDVLAYNNKVHAYKVKPRRTNKAHFMSRDIELVHEGVFMIVIKQKDNLIDIKAEPY